MKTSQSYIVRIEGGKVRPSTDALKRFAQATVSDDPDAECDPKRWKVQQQVALPLSRIYSESQHCGRTYCDGDRPNGSRAPKSGGCTSSHPTRRCRRFRPGGLLDRFKGEKVFWRQFEIGKALVAASDRGAIAELEAWLKHDDRHLRGNVDFVLGRLGDPRGFDTVAAILEDRSPLSSGQGILAETGRCRRRFVLIGTSQHIC